LPWSTCAMMAMFRMCNIDSKIVEQDVIWMAKVKPRLLEN
jgi:hypothetical protein